MRIAKAALQLTAQVGAPDGKTDSNRESQDRKVEQEIKTGDEKEGIVEQLDEDLPGDQQHEHVID